MKRIVPHVTHPLKWMSDVVSIATSPDAVISGVSVQRVRSPRTAKRASADARCGALERIRKSARNG